MSEREKDLKWKRKTQDGNREYRSDVFSMLLEDPARALDVYNALNSSNYDDPDMVEILQLDHISLSMRNDAAFIIDSYLNIYEHQSTYSQNMPLRCLLYFLDQIKDILKKRDLFSRRRIPIPTPHFVVFYNGLEKRPEEEVMRLSDSFCKPTDAPELEVICHVLNVNPTYQGELKEKSQTLYGYSLFVERVRVNQANGEDLDAAVVHAMRMCIDEHVLEDFFKARGDEVRKVMQIDMRWERREQLIREEEREEGREEGREETLAEARRLELLKTISKVQRKIARGKTLTEIADELEEPEDSVRPILETIHEKGIECSPEEIYAQLQKSHPAIAE